MRTLRILLPITFLTLLATLFALGQQPGNTTPAADKTDSKATVYIYRYKQFTGSALAPSVYLDEAELAKMENGRYFTVRIDPGKHVFHSNDKQAGVELDLKAGEQYFVRLEIVAGVMKGHGRLVLVQPEQGKYELQSSKLKPLDANKVIDGSRVSVEDAHLESPAK